MAGMHFEYDEQGGTFYYFLLSFWFLVLFPATCYLWPRSSKKDSASDTEKKCICPPCREKQRQLKVNEPWTKAKQKGINIGLAMGWIIFFLLLYKVSMSQMDYVEYDPFTELSVDRSASTADIKKAFRKLSLIYHPDRESGDSKKFMRIAKAYAALTDEESRKNWEEYGNPDGPGVTRFGIALPKWIVERENSVWVLAVYGLVFMILLPFIVGVWWYRSIKFSADQVLLDTTHLYLYFFNKTPSMHLKRVVMILASSWEYDRLHNAEIVERPSDNEELPALMRELSNLGENNKERPLCFPYSIKARVLLFAHMARKSLPADSLEIDKQYILKKCPSLINEMVNVVPQLVGGAVHGKCFSMPTLDTLENIMKLSQLLTQALQEKSPALLQLPCITQDMLKYFVCRKRNIRSVKDFLLMKDDDRRFILRNLSDEEYKNLLDVAASMPYITFEVKSEVIDDDDSTITAGSIVTVTVNLKRESMGDHFRNNTDSPSKKDDKKEMIEAEDLYAKEEAESRVTESPQRRPLRPWEKKKKKNNKKSGKKSNKKVKGPPPRSNASSAQAAAATAAVAETKEDKKGTVATIYPASSETAEVENGKGESENGSDHEGSENSDEDLKDGNWKDNPNGKDDDEDWSKYQADIKKETILETKSKESHPVHCPYFPIEKQECWWLYIADRKQKMLISAPVFISSLKYEEKIEVKFSAPRKPGIYHYSVYLRSDSYLDSDQVHGLRLDVKQAKIIEDHPQWEISDDDDDKKEEEASGDSDYSTDNEESDSE
ncbi:translocation protein SEC63 homolog [Octopus sinensis]|uniref:Translocation protein SEC63 homolog n=1 Tax=Octopus sinensis TaxID=2607531 RepID=A0A6P7U2U7_9MOLL|nr:translocation protein SEC63 homolog [Octopus sinensis]